MNPTYVYHKELHNQLKRKKTEKEEGERAGGFWRTWDTEEKIDNL